MQKISNFNLTLLHSHWIFRRVTTTTVTRIAQLPAPLRLETHLVTTAVNKLALSFEANKIKNIQSQLVSPQNNKNITSRLKTELDNQQTHTGPKKEKKTCKQ
jgi:hypothetical protein